MTLRVMLVGPIPHSHGMIDGGVAAATMYLAEALVTLPGVDLVGVRLVGGTRNAGAREDFGWPVVDLDLGRFSVSTMFWRQQRQLRGFIDRFKPDIIHAQGADITGFLALRAGIPSIVTLHGVLSECAKFRTSAIKRFRDQLQARITERFVVRNARHVVAITPYIARHYRQELTGTIHEVPNAVAPAFFEIIRRPERGKFLFAGRISMGKGLMDLVRAVALDPTHVDQVVFAGASPEPDFDAQLRAEIAKSGLNNRIRFAGLLDEAALLNEFATASALVLPSYQETAPMVVQQAMAAGLPVIATRVGGIPYLMEHELSGLLFAPGDAAELSRLVGRIGEDEGLGYRLAASARAKALDSFAARRVAEATLAAYKTVLASS